MMPSERSAAPPIIAGSTNHLRLLLTKANNAKIPPSPLLSALNTMITYLIVVNKVMVQIIRERVPKMSGLSITRSLIMELNTYKGEVPISP